MTKAFGTVLIAEQVGCPFINGHLETDVLFQSMFEADSYLSRIKTECNCGGTMEGEGWLATGKTLENGYTPEPNELLKIKYIQCTTCGDWQYS